MEPFRPIEANNNGQMVPRAESIWEGNYTNAAVARDATREEMLTAEVRRAASFEGAVPPVSLLTGRFLGSVGGRARR